MSAGERAAHRRRLLGFLQTIQKPDRLLETVGEEESLVAAGLIDSLAILQIVVYLEETYGIDFAARGVEPEELRAVGSILDLIEREAQSAR